MKNYIAFTLEDFVGDEDFRKWVQGRSDNESFWRDFIEEHPYKKGVLKQAEQIIHATNVEEEEITDAEIEREVGEFLTIGGNLLARSTGFEKSSARHYLQNGWLTLSGIAAVIILGLGLGWFYLTDGKPDTGSRIKGPGSNNMAETVNDSDKPLRLVLSDQSIVILSGNSKLRYPTLFTGNTRKVYLTGEARFSVTHTSQPFMVFTGEMVTKVLGTRFSISAFEKDKKISVQVQSGKVSVYCSRPSTAMNGKEINGVILTANQAAIFEKSVHQISKTLVSNPVVVATVNKVVNYFYDEVPLPVIFRELEKGYGIPIQFDEQIFEKCQITATLANETLYEKLDLLCKTVSATYEIVDGQIAISGDGCH